MTALLGLGTGVALNELADDVPHHRPVAWFTCRECGTRRPGPAWSALLALGLGPSRCPHCGRRWPIRSILVEIFTALAFVALWMAYGISWRFALTAAYTAVFIVVAVTDLEHRKIPNAIMTPALLLALLASPFAPLVILPNWSSVGSAIVGGLIGFGFFLIAARLGSTLFGRGALGDGDIVLATFVGLISGFPVIIIALILAVLAGGVISSLLILTRVHTLRSYIPYGPFIVVGGLIALYWGPAILAWYLTR